jgi:hypothetical protein
MSRVPEIVPLFDPEGLLPETPLRVELIRAGLKRVLPDHWGDAELPIFKWSEFSKPPFDLSFQLLCSRWFKVSQFFFNMIRHWLAPGRLLMPNFLACYDFEAPDLGDGSFVIAEMVLRIETEEELRLVRRNLPILAVELRLGAQSAYHADRILEVKGLSCDEKTAAIQEHIGYLVRRRPNDFGSDLFYEMQHFLVHCSDLFREAHECRQMSRIICIHYYFRKVLRREAERAPDRRHIRIKALPVRLQGRDRKRRVLGIFVGMNLQCDGEVCEVSHLLQAIRTFLPDVVPVAESFLSNESREDDIRTFYFEVERVDGKEIASADLQRIRRSLPDHILSCVEQKMHRIFLPRNEEEVMRHILTLSNQLKYLRDLPQVIISYLQQSRGELMFNVVVLRLLRPGDQSLEELLRCAQPTFRYAIDSRRIVGYVRKRYPKEASVVRVSLPKEPFLRRDQSLDVYRGRQALVEDLEQVFGEFRDFYGGMIQKQHELLHKVRNKLGPAAARHELLLENFFHSLTPGVMRSVLDPEPLATFFLLLVETLEKRNILGSKQTLLVREDETCLYLMIVGGKSRYPSFFEAVRALDIPAIQLATIELTVLDQHCLGLLYRGDADEVRHQLTQSIESVLQQPEPLTAHV